MRYFFGWLQHLREDERGNVLMIGASMIPLVFGAAALGVDTIQMTLAKRELQRSADSAALAGAHAVAQSTSSQASAAARTAALRALSLGRQIPLSQPATINNAPTSGSYIGKPDAVEVLLSTTPRLIFRPIFTSASTVINVRAVASKVGSTPACILALDPTADKALELTGNYNLSQGCGIVSNSNDSDQSIRITGNMTLSGDNEISAVGGIDVSGNASVPPTSQLFPKSSATPDPFASVPFPTQSGCTYNNLDLNGVTRTLDPGRYCGYLKINGASNITFKPGVHIIAGETFQINDGSVSGTGVTFALTRSQSDSSKWASLDWNGNANISLSSPLVSSGQPTAGLLVMQDRNTPSNNNKNSINGNVKMTLRGSFYFPNNELAWNGNVVTTAECLRVIGRVLIFNGNPGVKNNCTSDDGVMAATMVKRVRLVE